MKEKLERYESRFQEGTIKNKELKKADDLLDELFNISGELEHKLGIILKRDFPELKSKINLRNLFWKMEVEYLNDIDGIIQTLNGEY